MNTQTYTFHVHGMHCKACILTIEDDLGDLPNISAVKADLNKKEVEVQGDFGGKSESEIAAELTRTIEPHGYTLALEEQTHTAKWSDFTIAVPITLAFVILFVVLQKIGLINLVNTGNGVSYGTAFAIGIVASLSTCMAVVGGLLLSMSATFAKEGDRVKPQILFHGGRLIAFFVLGGVIGAIGSAFALSATATFILSLVIGLVMLVLGLNLLDVAPWAKRLQPTMPKLISKRAHGISKFGHRYTPFLVGVATFFLPCGFTQSMQLYTLTTGSFASGALTMLFFALGTFPILALLSFSSFSIQKSSKSGIFFKSAGLIVILFALFNLINSLAAIGIIAPVFNF